MSLPECLVSQGDFDYAQVLHLLRQCALHFSEVLRLLGYGDRDLARMLRLVRQGDLDPSPECCAWCVRTTPTSAKRCAW